MAHQRAALVLHFVHPSKDAVQSRDRFRYVWPLVQHHALGALGSRGISDLSPRRLARLGHRVEHLSRPIWLRPTATEADMVSTLHAAAARGTVPMVPTGERAGRS